MFLTRRKFIAFVIAFLFVFFYFTVSYSYQVRNAISYASRPLWDKPEGPRTLLTHYFSPGMDIDDNLCKMHGWDERTHKPEVWDAVIFSTELDLLEIRLNELDAEVDKFFIVESDKTFTGIPKPLYFDQNRARYARFKRKIVYKTFPGRKPSSDESPFAVEAEQRAFMSKLLRSHMHPHAPPPLVVFADVDEIPSAHTLRLLWTCAAPSPIHLQLRDYLYSFEWPVGASSWRAQVHEWGPTTYYRHSQAGDTMLADSGWHCSYCFQNISEFITKMQGFSHADRIGGSSALMDHDRIQKVICEGGDIFNMFPEAYTYKDFLALLYPEPTRSAVGLPLHLLKNADKFKFLLPGGCIRDNPSRAV